MLARAAAERLGSPDCPARPASGFQPPATTIGFGMQALAELIYMIVEIYIWVLIASAIMSWLVAFNVINMRNRLVYTIYDMSYRLTEPALRPIRRVLPNLGGIDISPVLLILLLVFLRRLIIDNLPY
jgi:YggT family protein